nr:isocitrate lyase/phosphoenolpyruvate mutase family protein [Methylobacterium nodulans]
MHDSGFFILPNAWDAGSAVRLTDAGFKAIASTSSRTQPARARSRTRAPSTSCSAS